MSKIVLHRIDTYVSDKKSEKNIFKKAEKTYEYFNTAARAVDGVKSSFFKTTEISMHIEVYDDFKYLAVGENMYMQSNLRGVVFVMNNIIFDIKHHQEDAIRRINDLYTVIRYADEEYEVKNSDSPDPKKYFTLLSRGYARYCSEVDHVKMIATKQEAKKEAKRITKFRYKIGEYYELQYVDLLSPDLEHQKRVYQVRKFIYTISESVVNIVIMKLIEGIHKTGKTLSQMDCRAFHIKYEPDLYVFPMNTRFTKLDDYTPPEPKITVTTIDSSDKLLSVRTDIPVGTVVYDKSDNTLKGNFSSDGTTMTKFAVSGYPVIEDKNRVFTIPVSDLTENTIDDNEYYDRYKEAVTTNTRSPDPSSKELYDKYIKKLEKDMIEYERFKRESYNNLREMYPGQSDDFIKYKLDEMCYRYKEDKAIREMNELSGGNSGSGTKRQPLWPFI